jgi:tagatose-1,6-bisphosphate aldolase non-catalytic subunit AgaZ/GatZ
MRSAPPTLPSLRPPSSSRWPMDPSFTLNPHQARSISLEATQDLPPANLRNGSIRRQKQLDYRRAEFCLGGDHFGPFPCRNEDSATAMEKACGLVRDCIAAGYQKIHLDTSMGCADDPGPAISEKMIASRRARLCHAAEEAYRELPPQSGLNAQ